MSKGSIGAVGTMKSRGSRALTISTSRRLRRKSSAVPTSNQWKRASARYWRPFVLSESVTLWNQNPPTEVVLRSKIEISTSVEFFLISKSRQLFSPPEILATVLY